MNNASTKYTAVLPQEYVSELRFLAKEKIIPSVNYGIKKAIGEYLEAAKRKIYAQSMAEAAQDADFLKRTSECQEDFKNVDSEVGGEW